jgi:hypothetical protein
MALEATTRHAVHSHADFAMRSWSSSFKEAVRINPRLSATLAIEVALLCYAALKARRGRSANVPSVEAVIEALPVIAAAVVAAPAMTPRTKRRH